MRARAAKLEHECGALSWMDKQGRTPRLCARAFYGAEQRRRLCTAVTRHSGAGDHQTDLLLVGDSAGAERGAPSTVLRACSRPRLV